VATAAGGLLVLVPLVILSCIGVWTLLVRLTKKSSLGSLCAAIMMPTLVYLQRPELLWTAVVITGGVLLRHQGNISRLMAGTER
jgi:glycerol-3-phosphate acyltransferase PlsY